jgi:hypothetical protein
MSEDFVSRQTSRRFPFALFAAVAALAVVASSVPASAQLFNFLFGSPRRAAPPPSASAYADPQSSYPGFAPHSRSDDGERRGEGGPSVAFCVRLCDGRYFPIQRSAGNPSQLCNSFCPASPTRTFSGSRIDHAVASDGSRYASLQNAFAYRDRVVDGCTCNGRDAFGLVTLSAANDPTLRSGDIVATDTGFVAYQGGRRQQAEFTPIESLPGLSADWRQRLAQTRITPRNATPVSADVIREGTSRNRRVQSDR